MSALLTSEAGDNDKIATFVDECKKMKLPVLQPDINLSFKDFGVIKATDSNEKDQIRFGLKTIKNLGETIADTIVEERKQNGNYKSLEDFIERNSHHKDLSKRSLEALALSGAFDSLVDRNLILGNINELLEYVKESRTTDSSQEDLFSNLNINHLKLIPSDGKIIKIKTGKSEELEYKLPMSDKDQLF